jgi:hypothetical protein
MESLKKGCRHLFSFTSFTHRQGGVDTKPCLNYLEKLQQELFIRGNFNKLDYEEGK